MNVGLDLMANISITITNSKGESGQPGLVPVQMCIKSSLQPCITILAEEFEYRGQSTRHLGLKFHLRKMWKRKLHDRE